MRIDSVILGASGVRAFAVPARREPMNLDDIAAWRIDWAWSLPLIILSVVIHVLGLGLINEKVSDALSGSAKPRRFLFMFAVVMGIVAMLAIMLHGIEVAAWAAAYLFLGALPDTKTAMLYSLGAMTTYGHANLSLQDRWQMMGALEALNGMLLFGLTTAFMFAMIQRVWPLGQRDHR
jgi:MFS superfamily sulfate permease-like transporter